jgi:hypothetical protein
MARGGDGGEPGREFGFEVLLSDKPVNDWHYRFVPSGAGTDVTESFRMSEGLSVSASPSG